MASEDLSPHSTSLHLGLTPPFVLFHRDHFFQFLLSCLSAIFCCISVQTLPPATTCSYYSLSGVTNLGLLAGVCAACMLAYRCLQMKWWAAVTVVAIPSQKALKYLNDLLYCRDLPWDWCLDIFRHTEVTVKCATRGDWTKTVCARRCCMCCVFADAAWFLCHLCSQILFEFLKATSLNAVQMIEPALWEISERSLWLYIADPITPRGESRVTSFYFVSLMNFLKVYSIKYQQSLCHTHEWFMCHTYEWFMCHTYEWVMWYTYEWVSCHTYEWVIYHTYGWILCHTHEWVMTCVTNMLSISIWNEFPHQLHSLWIDSLRCQSLFVAHLNQYGDKVHNDYSYIFMTQVLYIRTGN